MASIDPDHRRVGRYVHPGAHSEFGPDYFDSAFDAFHIALGQMVDRAQTYFEIDRGVLCNELGITRDEYNAFITGDHAVEPVDVVTAFGSLNIIFYASRLAKDYFRPHELRFQQWYQDLIGVEREIAEANGLPVRCGSSEPGANIALAL